MAEEEEKAVVKPPPPYVPIKYFVSSLNTFFGEHLVARLRNDQVHPDNPNRILGTKVGRKTDYGVPAGVRKVIDVGSEECRPERSNFSRILSLTRTSSSTT